MHTKIKIICSIHGVFEQRPCNHLQGAGCRLCADAVNATSGTSCGGFTHKRFKLNPELKTIPATFYVIECFNDNELFLKIGITTKSITERFKFKSILQYNYNILLIKSGLLFNLFLKEQELKKKYKHLKYKPYQKFNGYTECFSINAQQDLLSSIL